MQPLPIDPLLPELVSALRRHACVVLEAPPGAGKTTRVPLTLHAQLGLSGQIVIAEPRRLAARLAASYVAAEMNGSVGDLVGYSVRFEDKCTSKTRIRYATEGVLLRQLERDPTLRGVDVVILDEFHERHLSTDALLALLLRAQRTRPELRLVVMSATLDAAPIAAFLGDCPQLRSEGKSYPVQILHEPAPDDRPLERRVSSAIRELHELDPKGDVLVFLPGAREIGQCRRLLEERAHDYELHELHGELPLERQAAAVARGRRPKVVLATNVAESSVTIDGVTAVVDSGLSRVASYSAWSGRATLELAPISRQSATQRAGRAGRTAPGRVKRLYTEAELSRRPVADLPEIARLDLTELLLSLSGLGVQPEELSWLHAPPRERLDAARALLTRLEALDPARRITEVGRRMLDFGLPARPARVLVSAERLGIAEHGAIASALLAERDLRQRPRGDTWDLPSGPSDVQDRIDVYDEATASDFRPHALRQLGLDPGRVNQVRQLERQLRRRVNTRVPAPEAREERERLLRRALLHGYADRVALHQPEQRRLILENGTTAQVSPLSVVRHAPLVVALEEEERGEGGARSGRVQWMSAIEADWLLEDYPERITTSESLVWSAERGRVESVDSMSYGSVVLEQSSVLATPSTEASRLLFEQASKQRTALFGKDSQIDALRRRLELLYESGLAKGLPSADALSEVGLLERACDGAVKLEELTGIDWTQRALGELSAEGRALVREHTPTELTLPGGRRVNVNYEAGKPPWIASRLQDFFGMQTGPRICAGRVPLTLHLLAPNGRAVQVSADLDGFWTRHYAEVRKELRRRYPKHAWPEDGRTASPPAPRPRPRG